MKNKFLSPIILAFLSFFIISLSASANPFHDNHEDSVKAEIPTPEELLAEIISITGLRSNFDLKAARVLNIEASVSNRRRVILYNPDYINQINQFTGKKWAALLLLSHEVGHHLNGHTIKKSGSRPALELEADEFAGFVLSKLGASLKEAQEVIHYIASIQGSASHPSRASRLLAIENGWNKAAK